MPVLVQGPGSEQHCVKVVPSCKSSSCQVRDSPRHGRNYAPCCVHHDLPGRDWSCGKELIQQAQRGCFGGLTPGASPGIETFKEDGHVVASYSKCHSRQL